MQWCGNWQLILAAKRLHIIDCRFHLDANFLYGSTHWCVVQEYDGQQHEWRECDDDGSPIETQKFCETCSAWYFSHRNVDAVKSKKIRIKVEFSHDPQKRDKNQFFDLRSNIVSICRRVFDTLGHFSVFCLTLARSVQSETKAKFTQFEIENRLLAVTCVKMSRNLDSTVAWAPYAISLLLC